MGFKFKFIYRKWLQNGFILTLLLCLVMQTACMQTGNDAAKQSTKGTSKGLGLESENQNKLPLISLNGVQYVNAKELVELLGFQSEWNADTSSYMIGDKDVNLVLKINSREAQKNGDMIKLASPPVITNQSPYIPLSAIADLFQQDMSYIINDNHLLVQGNPNNLNLSIKNMNDQMHGDDIDFADDPYDPNKRETQQAASVLTNHHANIPRLIKKSKQYLEVNYRFGAKPYPQSGAFDCSSFTQYIYAKEGIMLKRHSREQAKQGITVSRKNLRMGDLLFFNVPGKFKSNNMVGHVGIYLGNKKMINANTQPASAVQITDINKDYWKKVFLTAKRVAS